MVGKGPNFYLKKKKKKQSALERKAIWRAAFEPVTAAREVRQL